MTQDAGPCLAGVHRELGVVALWLDLPTVAVWAVVRCAPPNQRRGGGSAAPAAPPEALGRTPGAGSPQQPPPEREGSARAPSGVGPATDRPRAAPPSPPRRLGHDP